MCSDTFTMMCLSLGTKIGVMDKMLSYEEPKSCKDIADDASLKERWGSTKKIIFDSQTETQLFIKESC